MSSKWEEIAAACEAAEGPDRTLDVAIMEALCRARSDRRYWYLNASRPKGSPDLTAQQFWTRVGPKPTASLDAIVALIREKLPDVGVSVGLSPDGMSQAAILYPNAQRPPFNHKVDRLDRHAALALCAALARAMHARAQSAERQGGERG